MADTLYDLIDQLTASGPSGKRLRRQFHDSPDSVTEDLLPEARQALYTMDRRAGGPISSYVLTEFQAEGRANEHPDWETWLVGWLFPRDEFAPKAKLPADCQYEGQAYPDPKPYVFDITPRAVSFATVGAGNPVEVVVVGQGLVSGRTRLELQDQATAVNLTVKQEFSGIEGSFRCGHLYAKVTMPAGTVNAAKTYDIRIIISCGSDALGNPVEEGPLPVRQDNSQTIVFTINP
jgi:hypothetical protein